MSTSSLRFPNVGNLGGFQGSDWTAYTPTFTGFGTATNVAFFWRRMGDSMEIIGKFTAGTTTATEARISLPSGYTSDSGKVPAIRPAGPGAVWYRDNAGGSAATLGGQTLIESGVTYITLSPATIVQATGSVNPFSKMNGNASINGTDNISISAVVPISGWSTTSPVGTVLNSEVMVYNTAGHGSTATSALIFSSIGTNNGTDITYATSATAADTFTINTSGIYAILFVIYAGTAQTFGISKNGSGATSVGSLARANRLMSANVAANVPTPLPWTGHLSAGDVIRAHTSGSTATADDRIQFSIVRMA